MAKQKPRQERRIETAALYNIFISWSKERSKAAALALREWLPSVLQAAKPWVSDTDIEKGSHGLEEIDKALNLKIGIICLTPENLPSIWVHYEAGALSRSVDDRARVCPYLLADLRPQDVEGPLGRFQLTRADKEDTRKLVHTINRNLNTRVADDLVDKVFDRMWPDLEAKLSNLPAPVGAIARKRSTDEMVAEILDLNRAIASELPKAIRENISEVAAQIQQLNFAIRPIGYNFSYPLAVNPTGNLAAMSRVANLYAPPSEPADTQTEPPKRTTWVRRAKRQEGLGLRDPRRAHQRLSIRRAGNRGLVIRVACWLGARPGVSASRAQEGQTNRELPLTVRCLTQAGGLYAATLSRLSSLSAVPPSVVSRRHRPESS